MVYQLQRPSIEMIIDYCRDLLADEKLEVYEFGQNCDLVLHIYKDGDYSPSADKDIFNMVRVHTARDGEWVNPPDYVLKMKIVYITLDFNRKTIVIEAGK